MPPHRPRRSTDIVCRFTALPPLPPCSSKPPFQFGLFHGDPHPGNIFCLRDGRIAYVDFGNVAQLSARNKAVLIDAVVHAVNEDYVAMAEDFIKLGFLAPGEGGRATPCAAPRNARVLIWLSSCK